jgi:hypothetical protein
LRPAQAQTAAFKRCLGEAALALDRLAVALSRTEGRLEAFRLGTAEPAGSTAMPTTGRCHCGSVAFEIDGEIPAQLTRCTCSFCSKRGQLYAYYAPAQVRLLTSSAATATYRWNSKRIAHQFCPTCGCGILSDSPAFRPDGSWDGKTRRLGLNARLFDNFDAAAAPVTVIDGKNLW